MSKKQKTFLIPARFEISVIASGNLKVVATNKEEALRKAEELAKSPQVFCNHLRNNGCGESFEVDSMNVSETLYHAIKGGYAEQVEIDLEAIEEEDDSEDE